jgi:hypothetical protein
LPGGLSISSKKAFEKPQMNTDDENRSTQIIVYGSSYLNVEISNAASVFISTGSIGVHL